MLRRLYKILFFVAVVTIVGHSNLPHLHYEDLHAIGQHHHDDDDGGHHNIFSFAQLDDDFVLTKYQKLSVDLPVFYLLTPLLDYHFSQITENSKTYFNYYREFPPPGNNYLSNLFSRPPPATFAV